MICCQYAIDWPLCIVAQYTAWKFTLAFVYHFVIQIQMVNLATSGVGVACRGHLKQLIQTCLNFWMMAISIRRTMCENPWQPIFSICIIYIVYEHWPETCEFITCTVELWTIVNTCPLYRRVVCVIYSGVSGQCSYTIPKDTHIYTKIAYVLFQCVLFHRKWFR